MFVLIYEFIIHTKWQNVHELCVTEINEWLKLYSVAILKAEADRSRFTSASLLIWKFTQIYIRFLYFHKHRLSCVNASKFFSFRFDKWGPDVSRTSGRKLTPSGAAQWSSVTASQQASPVSISSMSIEFLRLLLLILSADQLSDLTERSHSPCCESAKKLSAKLLRVLFPSDSIPTPTAWE